MKRYVGLDIVRVVAVLMIIGVHSLSFNGYYNMSLSFNSGPMLFLLTMIRWLFYACVPIFIIITGYLKKDKKIDKNHYKSLIGIIIDYLIICFIYLVYEKSFLGLEVFSAETLISIVNFKLMPYAWYLQLYIGLFLLIPFLNVMYNNLPTKRSKKILIITIVLLCGLATTINPLSKRIFGIESSLIITKYIPITYPLGLYFLGAYIKEYQISLPKIKNVFYILLALFLQAFLTYYYCDGGVFSWEIMGSYGNIFTFIVSGLVFCFFYNIKINNDIFSKVIAYLSKISFGVYLFLYFVDLIFYKYFTYLNVSWYKIIVLMLLSILLHFIICVSFVSIIEIFKIIFKKIFLKVVKYE